MRADSKLRPGVRLVSNFVTYAQNFEDLMLWRALRHVEDGFYIDVGAADPDEDSVTRAFYDRGWRGINIEPTPEHFSALSAARPRDITLQCLVGAQSGNGLLHHFADTGLSTTINSFAGRHVADGRAETILSLPILTLAEICQKHATSTVHFLKIDVEGGEAEVLRGADFSVYRPWIVVVEATEPGSQVENWSGWEQLLISAGYQFVWFDGLNRFYVTQERFEELRPAFLTPPNVFDLWVQPRGKQKLALNFASEKIAHLQSELQASTTAKLASQAELAQGLLNLDRTHIAMVTERDEAARLRDEVARLQDAFAVQDLTLAQARDALAPAQEALARRSRELERVHGDLARAQSALLRETRQLTRMREDSVKIEQEISRLRGENMPLVQELASQTQMREQMELTLAAVYRSRSWKVSAPLRGLGKLARGQPVQPRLRRLFAGAAYRLIKLAPHLPGGRIASRIIRRVAPGFHATIYNRVRARDAVSMAHSLEMVAATPPRTTSAQTGAADAKYVTAEEARIAARLGARSSRP
jgi:FkbM family methyltransferase